MTTPGLSNSRYKREGGEGEKDYAALRARRTEISDYTSQRLAELRSLRRAESESYADYKTRREARETGKDLGLSLSSNKDSTDFTSDYKSRRSNNDSGSSDATIKSPTSIPTITSPKESGPGAYRSESFRLSSEYKSVELGKDRLELKLKSTANNGSKNGDDDEFVGFATLPDQVHRKAVKRGFDFTLMVVGESGLGKSTLISSLFLNQDLYKERKVLPVEERVTKTVEIQKKYMEIEEKGVKLRLTIVDTPGFNDTVNAYECWKPIEDYINSQFDQFFKDESGLNRKNIKDNRVHCCLYFVSPYGHGLRQIDIAFMKRLHGLVNIVPVIAKADTLTPIELKKLKHKVLEQIEEHHIKIYEFPECDSDEDEEFKQQDKELKASIPFSVIGSNTVVEVGGKKVRGRLYPWGIVEVDNPAHCDFNKLRQMLISTHMQDLKDVTRDVHYENFRAKYIKEQMSRQQKERNNNLDAPTAAILSKLSETPQYNSKLKRDSSPNFEGIMDQDKLLQQKDEEIRKMQAMLMKMQEQLQAKGQQVNGQVNGLGNL